MSNFWNTAYRSNRRRPASTYSPQQPSQSFAGVNVPILINTASPKWIAFAAADPARSAWLLAKAPTFEFAASVGAKVADLYGQLTFGQKEAIDRMMVRDRPVRPVPQGIAGFTTPAPASVGIDAGKIADAFRRARAAGLTKIGLFFSGLVFTPARKDPERMIYVKAGKTAGAAYYGKIVDGVFTPSNACTPEMQARIVMVAADPMAAAQAHGYETNNCCICSRELTNKESVLTGIGPICAGRMGWTPGGLRRDNGIDF